MKRIYGAVLLTGLAVLGVPFGAGIAESAGGTATIIWPPVPKGDMAQLVPEAMAQVREGNTDLAAGLTRRADEALPLLAPYRHDPDSRIRERVWDISRHVHSPAGLKMLASFLEYDGKVFPVSANKLDDIAQLYKRSEIVKWGGAGLQKSVLKMARYPSVSSTAIVLAASYRTPETTALLKDLRRRARPGDGVRMDNYILEDLNAGQAFLADVALAETGDADALKRLRRALGKKRIQEAIALCSVSRLVDNKNVLRLIPAYLRDKRVIKQREIAAMGIKGCVIEKQPPMRICDLAARAMTAKVEADIQPVSDDEPLSAKELAAVRKRFARWL